MKKKNSLFLLIILISSSLFAQKQMEVKSPDGNVSVQITISDRIYYSISANRNVLFEKNHLQLNLGNQKLGEKPKLSKLSRKLVNNTLRPIVPLKFSSLQDYYNELRLDFKGNYSVEFRVYDDGVAYRFVTKLKGEVEVLSEEFNINCPSDYKFHLQEPGGFKTAYEEPYSHKSVSQ